MPFSLVFNTVFILHVTKYAVFLSYLTKCCISLVFGCDSQSNTIYQTARPRKVYPLRSSYRNAVVHCFISLCGSQRGKLFSIGGKEIKNLKHIQHKTDIKIYFIFLNPGFTSLVTDNVTEMFCQALVS